MTATVDARVHATVVLGSVVRDLAVPAESTVADVLARLRIDASSRAVLVTDTSGWRIAGSDVIGVDVPDGIVLTVSRGSAGATVSEDEAARARTMPRGADSIALAAAGLVLLGGATLLHLGMGPWGDGESAPTWWRPVVVGLLALVLLALVGRKPRERTVLYDMAALSTVSLALGALIVPPSGMPGIRLAIVVAPAIAGAVVALRSGISERRQDRSASSAALVATVWLGVALIGLVTIQTTSGLAFAAPILMGAVPPLLLAMPALAIDVPDEQLLDLKHVTRDASGPRQAAPKSPVDVTRPRVRRVVSTARARQDLVVVLLSLTAMALPVPVLQIVQIGGMRGWAATVVVVAAVVTLLLVPRTARSRLVRVLPRVAAFGMIAQIAWAAVVGGRMEALTVGMVAVVVALAVAGIAIAVGAGKYNVALARVGDIVQNLAIYLALPAGVVAAGTIQWVRQVGL
jgi:hypothetical protein